MIQNPLREGFHMSYFSMFLKNCTCVKNTFKSATTTTAARVFKTISSEAGPMFLHDLTCSRLRRYCWPPVEILSWLEKTYKRKCFLAETSVSLRLARELEPPWEWKFSPGQYAPKPGELHQGPGLVLQGGRPEEGHGGWDWCQAPQVPEEEEEEIRERQGWHGIIVCSEEDFVEDKEWKREEESRSDINIWKRRERLVKDQVDNQGGATLWGLWNPKSFPYIKIKCIRVKQPI